MSIIDKDEKDEGNIVGQTVARRYDVVYLRSIVVTMVLVFPSSFAMQRIANQAAGRSNDIVSYGLNCPRRSMPFLSTSFSSSFSPRGLPSKEAERRDPRHFACPPSRGNVSAQQADRASRPS